MYKKMLLSILMMILFFTACSYGPIPQEQIPQNSETQQALIEQAVRSTATTSAMLTQIAQLETRISQPTKVSGVTEVADGSDPGGGSNPVEIQTFTPTPVASATLPPTATFTLAPTAMPTITFTPTATPTSTSTVKCNEAKFEGDVTIPDGTTISPGATFTKTWRLRNSGSCAWTTSYDIVFSSGSQMNAPAAVDFPGTVIPGQVIDLSVTFTAPTKAGSYRSNWKLRSDAGVLFGLGKTDATFYADIKVSETVSSSPLDFAAAYCTATWKNKSETIPCPGTKGDSRGFVYRVDKPTLESGYVDDEPALLMHPQMLTNGYIRGIYPAIRVENGYDFTAVIGCANKAEKCDVNFILDYQIGNGDITRLNSWHEVYDGKYRSISVDLSALAGKDVKFILSISANGSYTDDLALWLAPKINK